MQYKNLYMESCVPDNVKKKLRFWFLLFREHEQTNPQFYIKFYSTI